MVEVSIAAALRNVIGRILSVLTRFALSTFADMNVGKRDYAKCLTREPRDWTVFPFYSCERRGPSRLSFKPRAYRSPGYRRRTRDDPWNDGVEISSCECGKIAFQLAIALDQGV